MLGTINQTENSCTCEEIDGEFSKIEEELENKLWELHDRIVNQTYSWKKIHYFNFAKSP